MNLLDLLVKVVLKLNEHSLKSLNLTRLMKKNLRQLKNRDLFFRTSYIDFFLFFDVASDISNHNKKLLIQKQKPQLLIQCTKQLVQLQVLFWLELHRVSDKEHCILKNIHNDLNQNYFFRNEICKFLFYTSQKILTNTRGIVVKANTSPFNFKFNLKFATGVSIDFCNFVFTSFLYTKIFG